jgi:predicted TIM-barrel fold metal-dependent hydrolase
MRIITLEEHLTTPLIVSTLAVQGQALTVFAQRLQQKLLDVGTGRLADMDAAGISLQVLSLSAAPLDRLPVAEAVPIIRDANDVMAGVMRAHPTRFGAFAALPMQEPDAAVVELERCVKGLGFQGVMVSGTVDGRFLDDARFTPFFEAAQALDTPIYLHPAPPPEPVMRAYFGGLPGALGQVLATAGWGWHVETGLHVLRLIATGVFDRFPRLKIVVGHMGENLPFSIARAEAVLGQVAGGLQRKVGEYFREHFYLTTSGYFTRPPFDCMLQVVGIDRILFSVDYPFSSNETGRAFLDGLGLNPTDLAKVAHGNAAALLKL